MTQNTAVKIAYLPARVPTAGWTVIERTGTRSTGYTERRVAATGLTMHQAQATADAIGRDAAQGCPRPETAA